MPIYHYVAKTKDAKTVRDRLEGSSKEEVIAALKARELFIVSVREEGEKQDKKPFLGGLSIGKGLGKHKKVKNVDMSFFARNLSVVLSSGVPLLRSLEILAVQTESLGLSNILKRIGEDIKGGLSLSEAISKYPKVFSSLWTGIISVGEASGNLPFVLEQLADYLELRLEFERKVKSALVYPVMVSVFSVIAVLIFFKFILPKFIPIFTQFNVELPPLTQFLFNASTFVNKNFFLVVAGIGAVCFGFKTFKDTSLGKNIIAKLNLSLPLLRSLTLIGALERFSSTMYILLESGVPIVYTLEVTSKGIGNPIIENKILNMRDNIKKGKSLSEELSKIGMFPPLIAEIARIGEEAGNMPQMFQKIAMHYQKELGTRLERLVAAFEPLMIAILGVGIGTIVMGLFMPIFKMVQMSGN